MSEALQTQITQLENLLRDPNNAALKPIFESQLVLLRTQLAGERIGRDVVGRDKIDTQIHIHPPAKPSPENDVQSLREAYLMRVLDDNNRTPQFLSSLSKDKLKLSTVYTALMTTAMSRDKSKANAGKHRGMLTGEVLNLEDDVLAANELSALEVANQSQFCVLLGGPGSGKSTFVNFVAACMAGEGLGDPDINLKLLCAPLPKDDDAVRRDDPKRKAEQPQPWGHSMLMPVQVVLRNFAASLPENGKGNAKLLWDFIEANLRNKALGEFAPHLKAHLLAQGGLILLDGLDEVPDAKQRRQQVKDCVQEFASTYRKCRFLVTSRTYAYREQDWKLRGFEEAVLRNFTLGQIDQFVGAWYAKVPDFVDMEPSTANARADKLKQAVRQNPKLRELAERPLLLSLIVRLQTERGAGLPEKRQQLYEESVKMLIFDWESFKPVEMPDGTVVKHPSLSVWLEADPDRMRAQLQQLAFEVHRDQVDQQATADIPESKLIAALVKSAREQKTVDHRKLREYLSDRAGILASHGGEVFQFPHRTFQEYLAACHLTRRSTWPAEAVTFFRAEPTRWREAVLLAGAKAKDFSDALVWDLVEGLCCHPAPLAQATVAQATLSPDEASAALLAAQVMIENDLVFVDEQREERFEQRRLRVRDWMRVLIRDNTLPAVQRAEAGRALAKLGDPRTEVMTVDAIELCDVPAGDFWMGAEKDHPQFPDDMAYDDEGPLHRQFTAAFRIARYPITQAQYAEFVEAMNEPANKPDQYDNDTFHLPNHPMVGVSWRQAVAFTDWLTERWRRDKKISNQQVVRLPTEAEWEKAARGMADARRYPWGVVSQSDVPNPNAANYDDSGIGSTSAVGCFSLGQTPFGCEDMSGNVWEWTLTKWLGDYQDYDQKVDTSLQGEDARVLRGGSFNFNDNLVRCAYRNYNIITLHYDLFGFRVCVPHLSTL